MLAFVAVFAIGIAYIAGDSRRFGYTAGVVQVIAVLVGWCLRLVVRRLVARDRNVNKVRSERLALIAVSLLIIWMLYEHSYFYQDQWGTTWRVGPVGLAHTRIGPTGWGVGHANWWFIREKLWVWVRYLD